MSPANFIVSQTLSDSLNKSVEEFKVYAKQTAIGILEMGRVVYEAKTSLTGSTEFNKFCDLIGYKHDSSSIKKLKLIGEKYMSLKNKADHLPNNWTTLYEISRLGEDKLQSLIEEGRINQKTIGSDIKLLLKDGETKTFKEDAPASQVKEVLNGTGFSFNCHFVDVSDLAFKAQLEMIIENLKRMKVKIDLSDELKGALESKTAKIA